MIGIRLETKGEWRTVRLWAAVGIVIAAYFLTDLFESSAYHAIAHLFVVRRSPPNTLQQGSYGLRMFVRLTWNTGLWFAICLTLGDSPVGFPMKDGRFKRHLLTGLGIGLAVMLAVLLAIWVMREADVSYSMQTLVSACRNGSIWLLLDFLGAAGEEIYGRAIVLALSERLFGWKIAILLSGLMFSGIHLSNPGAAWIWLLRLFLQGSLLAYAVFRTRSIWWSVGYHTGWNWISAPLFGAAGSGYIDQGHILNFYPRGSVWFTGGAVGPEGSVFAFLAVLAALALLILTTGAKSHAVHRVSDQRKGGQIDDGD